MDASKNNLIGTRQHVESHQNMVRLSYKINSRQNTNQMLAQMSADMWQAVAPKEEIALEAARRRAKEEDERAREEQARRQEEAEKAARDAEAIKQQAEVAKAQAEADAQLASSQAAQLANESNKLALMLREEQQKQARRKDEEAAAQEFMKAKEAERLRAKAAEEEAAKAKVHDLEDELQRVEDHQWTKHREKGCGRVGWGGWGVVWW